MGKTNKIITFGPRPILRSLTAIIWVAFFVFGNSLDAQEAWPLSTDWVGVIQADWTKSADPPDQSSDYLDIVPDDNGYDSYFYSTATTIFVKLGLEGTVIDSKGLLKPFAWQAPIDVDDDNIADWNIVVAGISEALRVYYDNTGGGDPSTLNFEIPEPIAAGYVREVASPTATYPDYIFLEFQVPYTALQGSGLATIDISLGTPISFYFSTATSESISIKDATGGSATITEAFANAVVVGIGTSSFGFIHDSLDPDPYTSGATYANASTVNLSGNGWPPSTGLSAYIKDSAGTQVWSGTVTTDANGDFVSQASWTVGGSYAGGEFTIWVTHPTIPAEGDASYDTFTVPDPPILGVTKSANVDTVYEGNNIIYTATISNTGLGDAAVTTVLDTLPAGLSYVTGSSSNFTTSDPTVSGSLATGYILTWSGTWSVLASNNGTLVFETTLESTYGDSSAHSTYMGVEGSDFDAVISGAVAPVTFMPAPNPIFTIAKTVFPTTVSSGDTVQYTVTITNEGNANENGTAILDTLPAGFSYIPGSSSGITTSDPGIIGQTLAWIGTFSVPKDFGTQSLTFSARTGYLNTTYYNHAAVTAATIGPVITGSTAALIVQAPELVLSKTVDIANAAPGDTLTYSITYSNVGDADATVVTIIENIPANTIYVDGSATATPVMDISFTTVSTVITSIQFLKIANLAPGSSGSLTFKVIVD